MVPLRPLRRMCCKCCDCDTSCYANDLIDYSTLLPLGPSRDVMPAHSEEGNDQLRDIGAPSRGQLTFEADVRPVGAWNAGDEAALRRAPACREPTLDPRHHQRHDKEQHGCEE